MERTRKKNKSEREEKKYFVSRVNIEKCRYS